jgi:hypothetical protein
VAHFDFYLSLLSIQNNCCNGTSEKSNHHRLIKGVDPPPGGLIIGLPAAAAADRGAGVAQETGGRCALGPAAAVAQ